MQKYYPDKMLFIKINDFFFIFNDTRQFSVNPSWLHSSNSNVKTQKVPIKNYILFLF